MAGQKPIMPNKYQLRQGVKVRLEYFGGMIIDVANNVYYQIPRYDALVLFCLNYECDIKIIQKEILTKLGIKEKFFDFKLYEDENFITTIKKERKTRYNLKELILNIKDILSKIKNIKHLSAPLNITIYPSFVCQANCDFCYVKNYCEDEHKSLSFEDIKNLINNIEKMQVPYISILGGEPLLLPYFKDLLVFMSKKDVVFNITTNAWLLDGEIISLIKKYKNINLSISLQSVDDYHTLSTKLDYERVLNNIRETKSNCRINTVYVRQTFKQLEELIDFVHNERIESFTLVLYNNINLSAKEQIENHKNFLKAKQHLINYIRNKKYNIIFRAEGCLQYLFEQEVKIIPETTIEKIFTKCEAGNLKLEILPNGDTIGCTALNNNIFKSGNIFKTKLGDIWNDDEKLNLLRGSICKDEECRGCRYFSFCNGGCPAQRFLIDNNFEKVRDKRCLKKI